MGATETIGFVGLGAMGLAMASNMQRFLRSQKPPKVAHEAMLVHNRSPVKAEVLTRDPQLASEVVASPAELAKRCSIIFMMLSDDAATRVVLEAVMQELEPAGAPGPQGPLSNTIVVSHSTNYPDLATAMKQQLQSYGAYYVSAPVFGRPDAAAAARLVVVPAGAPEALDRLRPLLQAYGKVLPPVSDDPAKANVVKLSGNFMLVSMIEALSQAMTLAEKSGVARASIVQLVDAFFPAPAIQGYAKRIANDELDAGTGFTCTLALKDVRYMRQLSEANRSPLPLADMAFGHLLTAVADGHGDKDWGAIALAVRAAAGLREAHGGDSK